MLVCYASTKGLNIIVLNSDNSILAGLQPAKYWTLASEILACVVASGPRMVAYGPSKGGGGRDTNRHRDKQRFCKYK